MRRLTVVVVAVALLVACSDDDGNGSAGGETARYREAAAALCTATDQARADVMAARTIFYDRSHDALHDIARSLDPVDRAASGRLLEAKQRVEAGLDASAPPPDLVADLERLAGVTRDGLARLDVEVPPCG